MIAVLIATPAPDRDLVSPRRHPPIGGNDNWPDVPWKLVS
jgi:hypothetical protein